MAKLTVRIDGFGAVKVTVPKRFRKGKARAEFNDSVASAVAATMTLAHPRQGDFHMALGFHNQG